MTPVIFAKQFADVVRRLRQQGVRPDDPQLFLKFQNAYQTVLGGGVDQRASQIDIDLPDLEEQTQADIIRDNVLAVSALYYAAQLEELKFFQVADKIAEQFEAGQVPISRGLGGESIYKYIRSAPDRFTESERRSFYARAFGFAQGSVDEPMPNREFSDLWIRFLSSVSILNRESAASFGQRRSLTPLQMFKNARDLAVNISLHGYGVVHFAAVELQDLIRKLLDLMSYPDVLAAYGVPDPWALVERISGAFLGGAVNGVRQRTLATSGYRIIQWLAANQQLLADPYGAAANYDITVQAPDLISYVERWLAVTGTGDTALDKYFEPVSVSSQPTIPTMQMQGIPDLLKGVLPRAGNGIAAMPGLQALAPNLPNLTPVKA
jgi:hypothetical protein